MKRLAIVTLAAGLFMSVAQAQAPASAPKPESAPSAKAAVNASDDPAAETLPRVTLTREILYRLLSADLAYQRGQWKTAYSITMRVARQTRDPRIARRAAEIAISAKQPNEAMAAVKLWRDLDPQSEEATKYYLGFVLINDDLAEARPIFAQRLKEATPPVRGILMFQMQRLLAGLRDKDKAFALLEELLAPYGGTAEAHIALAQGALSKGDRLRAIAEANRALGFKAESELAILTLAQASENAGQALDILSRFIETYPKAREVRLAYARILISQKRYELARRQFEVLLELQPHDTTVLYSLGLLSAQTNDPRNAERYLGLYMDELEKQQGSDRDPAQVLLLLAQLADERGDEEAALKWLSQIEPREGNNAIYLSAVIKSAQISARRGDLGQARKKLAQAETETDAEKAQIILAEGQIMRDAGKAEEAFSILEAGVKRFPKDAHLLYDFAMAAEKLDKVPEMEAALRKLIALEPDNHHAYNALGYSLADRNLRLEEAHQLVDKALKLAPNDPYIMDSMGWVLFRQGKLKEAEDWLRRAYEKKPEAEIGAHLGEVLWLTGRRDEARALWRAAAEKEPKNETLKNTLKRFGATL